MLLPIALVQRQYKNSEFQASTIVWVEDHVDNEINSVGPIEINRDFDIDEEQITQTVIANQKCNRAH